MVFMCQRDSFMVEYYTKVVSCTPGKETITREGNKPELVEGYEIILEDTILFPEGGGQNDDHGSLNTIPVYRVTRRGQLAVHFTTIPIEPGSEVVEHLNWARRFDHMQQHSGQHLISSLAEKQFGYATTSWWLGDTVSYIELDTTKMTTEQMLELENVINEKILYNILVSVDIYEPGDPYLKGVRGGNIPVDSGPIRVVTIAGIDVDMCCGTHVANLGQLQTGKLLYFEKGKKNKTNLYFLFGKRVLQYLQRCVDRERKITELLKNGPPDHVMLIDKLQKSLKLSQKSVQTVLKDVAAMEVMKFKSLEPRPLFFSIHRREAEADFINTLIHEMKDESVCMFVTIGDEKLGAGQMMLAGSVEVVKELGPSVCELLAGKGAVKGTRFQAKVTRLDKRADAEQFIHDKLGNQGQGDI